MIQDKPFKKKVYSFPDFARDFFIFHKNIPALISSVFHRKISKALEEKIMLAVTSVNFCKYCEWFHTREALKAGMDQNEIKMLLSSQLSGDIKEEDLPALNFALHYAESCKRPEPDMVRRLYDFYGEKTAREIMLKLRLIYFGNLCGNTFEAFLSRLKGAKAEKSFWLSELVIFLIISPLYGLLSLMMRKGQARSTDEV